eukprot:CAMPEP_0198497176 /NCGR_PEP_ID=MMETSP1462-20131121/6252_1 /TAXON_ID=1333877 /ORGANISM="Brandtodinium nutriculum, Strain RCC3387" /LENGTH=235 /DNA_ID=CAMNT_0044226035 /DNA_START=168 /DNA_END=871 /DNA_ORIENTATION=-
MPAIFHEQGRVVALCPALQDQVLRVPKRDGLILGAVDDEGRASDVAHSVPVPEHVAGERHPCVHGHPVHREQRRLQHEGPDGPLGGQVDRRARADGPAVRNDPLPWDADDVLQVAVRRVDVGIERLLARDSRAHPVACVLVCKHIHIEDVANLSHLLDDAAEVLGISMAKQEGILRVLVDVERRNGLVRRRGEPNQIRVPAIRRVRRLKDDGRQSAAHCRRTPRGGLRRPALGVR